MRKLLFTLVIIPLLANAHPGVGIVMDKKGNVFYTDLTHIWKINTEGKKSVVVRNVHSHELFIDDADNLFGEHLWYEDSNKTWHHYVWKLSPTGTLSHVVPASQGFLINYSFVRDHRGNMFMADREGDCQHITKQGIDGSVITLGDSCFKNIRWMTSDSDGTLYVIDLHEVKKVDVNGHVVTLVKQLSVDDDKDDIHALMGISVDMNRNVYVADNGARAVKKIHPSGEVSTIAKTNVPWAPSGQLVAPNGDYWILEYSLTNSVRVERIRPNGERTIF